MKLCRQKQLTANAGSSLLEVMIAIAVLAVSLAGTISSLYSAEILGKHTKSNVLAFHVLQQKMEEMRSSIERATKENNLYAIQNLYTTYGSYEQPVFFDVPGLSRWNPEIPVGKMYIVSKEDTPNTNSKVDLNLDGDFDDVSPDLSYKVFPVRIVITWNNMGRKNKQFLCTLIMPSVIDY